METSPNIKEIAAALKDFQASAPNVTKDGTNPHFRSKFATLQNIIETIREPLAKHGLSYAQFPDGDGLTTVLMHTSGEWIRATARMELSKHDPQGQGSAITYMRRYALSSALGIATEDDDDGNEASKPPVTRSYGRKDPAVELKAKKDRIMKLLELCELPRRTKEECEESVKEATDLTLEEKNYDAIIISLSSNVK